MSMQKQLPDALAHLTPKVVTESVMRQIVPVTHETWLKFVATYDLSVEEHHPLEQHGGVRVFGVVRPNRLESHHIFLSIIAQHPHTFFFVYWNLESALKGVSIRNFELWAYTPEASKA